MVPGRHRVAGRRIAHRRGGPWARASVGEPAANDAHGAGCGNEDNGSSLWRRASAAHLAPAGRRVALVPVAGRAARATETATAIARQSAAGKKPNILRDLRRRYRTVEHQRL